MRPVLVVDYGRGNLFSISRALAHLGAEAKVTSDPAACAAAQGVILNGGGAGSAGAADHRPRARGAPP